MPVAAGVLAFVVAVAAALIGRHYRAADAIDHRPDEMRRAGDQPPRTTMRNHAGTSGMIV